MLKTVWETIRVKINKQCYFEAMALAREFAIEYPDDPYVYAMLAECYTHLGQNQQAIECLRIVCGLSDGESLAELDAPTRKLASFTPTRSTYPEILARPSSYLGRWNGRHDISPHQNDVIKSILETSWTNFQNGKLPIPEGASVFNGIDRSKCQGKALIAMRERVHLDEKYIDSDIMFHFSQSAKSAGLDVSTFPLDKLLSGNRFGIDDATIKSEKVALQNMIEAFAPDIVVIDGNVFPEDRRIESHEISEWKRMFGFKVATVIADCYDLPGFERDDRLRYWLETSDVIVLFHPYSSYIESFPEPDRLLIVPSIPLDQSSFDLFNAHKTMEIFFSASNKRQRELIVLAASASGLGGFCKLHNRTKTEAPSMMDYIKGMSMSKFALNNGRIGDGGYIITARCTEAILANALLLEEIGSPLDLYYIPYVHYVPFSNATELVVLMQFFNKNEDARKIICDQAQQYYNTNYSYKLFWAKLLNY